MTYKQLFPWILSIAIVCVATFGVYLLGNIVPVSIAEAAVSVEVGASLYANEIIIANEPVPMSEDAWLSGQVTPTAEELEIFKSINAYRNKNNLPGIIWSDELYIAAAVRAGETNTLFSHERPGGRKWKTIFDDLGIYSPYSAENIAIGYDSAGKAVDAWIESEGHRANILGKSTHFAVAMSKCPTDSPYHRGYAFVALFGTL
jgi:uncharacterized protein YkwD